MTFHLGREKNIKAVVVEFAGIKFKLKDTIKTGGQYITYAKDFVIKHYLHVTPNINRMVLCEEKYRFTPDDLKAATRANRNKKVDVSISLLKTDDEMVSSENIDTTAIKSTGTGRIGIGNYLAEHAGQMQINHNLTLDIDSEYNLHQCQCLASSEYECRCEDINKAYATPVRYKYCQHEAVTRQHLQDIIQRKGEAEMSQLDWLMDCETSLESSESIVSAVTSGDIDSVIIHLFALSHLFPRNSEGKFKAHVYVYLQTPGTTYNVTKMIEILENNFNEPMIAMKIAMVLCIGGNDFIPKYHGYSHDAILKVFLKHKDFQEQLFILSFSKDGGCTDVKINADVYDQFIKTVYTPKQILVQQTELSFEETRQITMKFPNVDKLRHPKLWLPPESALRKIASLIDCQLDYLLTAGYPSAITPFGLWLLEEVHWWHHWIWSWSRCTYRICRWYTIIFRWCNV